MSKYKLVVRDKSVIEDYSKIPIAFEVKSKYEVRLKEDGLGGYDISEVTVEPSYIKDYDEGGKYSPLTWLDAFDTSNWAFFLIYNEKLPVAGAAAIYKYPKLNILDGRDDLAVLWDIRVHPDYRGRGLGRRLINAAIDWAKERNCTQLKIETQNVNVNACKFYHAMGAEIKGIRHNVYKGKQKDEIQFLWYIDL